MDTTTLKSKQKESLYIQMAGNVVHTLLMTLLVIYNCKQRSKQDINSNQHQFTIGSTAAWGQPCPQAPENLGTRLAWGKDKITLYTFPKPGDLAYGIQHGGYTVSHPYIGGIQYGKYAVIHRGTPIPASMGFSPINANWKVGYKSIMCEPREIRHQQRVV